MFRDFVVVFGLVRIGPFLSHRFVCDFSFCVRSWDSILFFLSSLRSVVCFDRISVTTCYTHAYALTRLAMSVVGVGIFTVAPGTVKRCLLVCSCWCVCKHSGTVKVPTVFFLPFFFLMDAGTLLGCSMHTFHEIFMWRSNATDSKDNNLLLERTEANHIISLPTARVLGRLCKDEWVICRRRFSFYVNFER